MCKIVLEVCDMGKYCSNCGTELKENADVCLSCGQLINTNINATSKEGKGLATVSVVLAHWVFTLYL